MLNHGLPTTTIKHFVLSCSIPPNTHCPLTRCNRWYFCFPNLLSSICTIFPSAPIFWLLSNIVISQTSGQKLSQSMLEWSNFTRDLDTTSNWTWVFPPLLSCFVQTSYPFLFMSPSFVAYHLSVFFFPISNRLVSHCLSLISFLCCSEDTVVTFSVSLPPSHRKCWWIPNLFK